jgi:hypothetical protein
MHTSHFSILMFIFHFLVHYTIVSMSSVVFFLIQSRSSPLCHQVPSSASLQLFPLVPFIRSSMKRLNRVGGITEPCGRPILVSNCSPKKSPSMHLAVLPERYLVLKP